MNSAKLATEPGQSATGASRGAAGLLLAVAFAWGLASILTADAKYSADRWPENRPFPSPFFSANDRSRWCTVWSLVERGTYQIDEIASRPGWDTIDKVRLHEHFYSSKPPFLATLAAGPYWVLKHALQFDLAARPHQAARAILILFNLLPWVAALALLAGLLERHARQDLCRITVMIAAAFCTLLTPFLVTFNNHTVAAASLLFTLAPLFRIAAGNERSGWLFARVGFWGAFTVCCELPAVALGAWLFVYLVRLAPRPALLAFLPAAAMPAAFFLLTNWLATGSLVPVYAQFSAANSPYKYVVEGIPSYWMEPSAIDLGEPSALRYLFHCVIGHHGIFSLSPIFLATVAGWMTIVRSSRHPLGLACRLSLGLTLWVLAFYVLKSDSRNYGGMTSGLRWAFWLVPLWLLGMVPLLDRVVARRGGLAAVAVLLAFSAFSSAFPRYNPWQQPWIAQLLDQLSPAAPAARAETFATWLGEPPALGAKNEAAFVELAGWASQGARPTLRIELLPAAGADRQILAHLNDGRHAAPVTFALVSEEQAPSAQNDRAAARRLAPARGVPQADRVRAAAFLRGLPGRPAYRAGSVRYLKTPLRPEAFRCRVLSAAVDHAPAEGLPPLRFRRVVWQCDEVPFGVVQIEDSVLDPRDNALLFKQRLTAGAASGFAPAAGARPSIDRSG